MLIFRSILTNNQISPWRHGNVIPHIKDSALVRFNKKFQFGGILFLTSSPFIPARNITPDLPFPVWSTRSTNKKYCLAIKKHTFASSKNSSTFIQTLLSQIIFWGFNFIDINPAYIEHRTQSYSFQSRFEKTIIPRPCFSFKHIQVKYPPIASASTWHISNCQSLKSPPFM